MSFASSGPQLAAVARASSLLSSLGFQFSDVKVIASSLPANVSNMLNNEFASEI